MSLGNTLTQVCLDKRHAERETGRQIEGFPIMKLHSGTSPLLYRSCGAGDSVNSGLWTTGLGHCTGLLGWPI